MDLYILGWVTFLVLPLRWAKPCCQTRSSRSPEEPTAYTDPFGLSGTKIMKTLAQYMNQESGKTNGIDGDRVVGELKKEGLLADKLRHVEKMLRLSFGPTSQGWLIEKGNKY